MFQNIDIRKLSEKSGAERAFISLYLSGKDGMGTLNKRVENIRILLKKNPDELEHFEENLKLIYDWLEKNPPNSSPLCVFASWAMDYVEGFAITVEVPDLLWIGAHPYIRPLVELRDEYENFLIVLINNKSAKILQIISAIEEDEESMRGGIKNRVKKGGWSQKRYSRRRDNQLLHYAKGISEKINEILEKETISRIILMGSKESVEELEEQLSPAASEKIAGKKFIDFNEEKKELLDEAYEIYFEEERRSEQNLWKKIEEEYLSEGLAVVGATDVLKASIEGRVEEMIVTRDAKINGTRCRDCESIVHGTPQTCQMCGSKSVFKVDLVDEIVTQLELTGAKTDFVDPIPELSELGDIAALLRY
jgi:peptide subunit release factor 1 (eRF1)